MPDTRRTATLLVPIIAAAAVVILLIAASSDGGEAPVVVGGSRGEGAGSTAGSAPVDRVPGAIAQLDRTTAEGFRLRLALFPTVLPATDHSPVECHDPTTVDVVVDTPDGAVATRRDLPVPRRGEVAYVVLQPTGSGLDPLYAPRSADDPRLTDAEPAPLSVVPHVLVVRGDGIERVTVRTDDGRTDTAATGATGTTGSTGSATIPDSADELLVVGLDSAARPVAPATTSPTTSTWSRLVSATIEHRDGTTSTIDLTDGLHWAGAVDRDGTFRPSATATLGVVCTTIEPPPLPANGPDGADPATAAEVTSLVETVGDATRPLDERAALTDDPELMTQLAADVPLLEQSTVASVTVNVTGVSFPDADTAILTADVLLSGTVYHRGAYAKVVRTSDGWRLTWQSVCALASASAMPTCAGATTDYPPEARRIVPER